MPNSPSLSTKIIWLLTNHEMSCYFFIVLAFRLCWSFRIWAQLHWSVVNSKNSFELKVWCYLEARVVFETSARKSYNFPSATSYPAACQRFEARRRSRRRRWRRRRWRRRRSSSRGWSPDQRISGPGKLNEWVSTVDSVKKNLLQLIVWTTAGRPRSSTTFGMKTISDLVR